jgi:NAD(P)-dependent dehydrogenase (short-subunit alcohol dehydrogenase family)
VPAGTTARYRSSVDRVGALGGKGAVVTGAGHGIGRALAARLVAEGARVVVNDLDDGACHAVADEVGATAAPGDCSSAEGVAALVDSATQALGRIDVYLANAGIDRSVSQDRPDSLQAPDEVWEAMLETNVMAHVRAARLLVPTWLADGKGGRFVVTASAAGLLTMIGAAPYSVTKHAAVGFAEWLSVTYGGRGIAVQAICPQGVQTRMLEQAGPLKDLLSRDQALTPEQVAEVWVASLEDDRFLVLPHPEVAGYYAARAADTDRWLAGMRGLQAKIDDLTGAQG